LSAPQETTMDTVRSKLAGRRLARMAVRAAAVAACALSVCACQTDQQTTGLSPVSTDYRQRHPITLQEADHTIQLFIGSNRGELNPTQRADVMTFGLGWKREATGGVIVERPVGSVNERASADAMREVVSILAASGVPPQSTVVQTYNAAGSALATVRVSYPRVQAQAGPCGLWPQDIGPTLNRDYFENQPPWNHGCATQRALASEIVNPSDLVQPRGETPAYTMRRTTVFQKYTEGQDPSTQDASGASAAKISDFGK
jgi:pilus assembly protein CpaD